MKKFKDYLSSFGNFAVIAIIILGIIFGLQKMGLIDSSTFFGNMFDSSDDGNNDKTNPNLPSLPDQNTYSYTITKTDLDKESVLEILSSVTVSDNYVQDLQFAVISDFTRTPTRVMIVEKEGISTAYFFDNSSDVIKQIERNDSKTTVTTKENGSVTTSVYNNGNINFEEEVGLIISHRDFLESVDDENYIYSLATDSTGVVLLLEFVTEIENYTQKQTYALNLDFGVVTSALCYENENLVYSMSTNILTSDTSSIPSLSVF